MRLAITISSARAGDMRTLFMLRLSAQDIPSAHSIIARFLAGTDFKRWTFNGKVGVQDPFLGKWQRPNYIGAEQKKKCMGLYMRGPGYSASGMAGSRCSQYSVRIRSFFSLLFFP